MPGGRNEDRPLVAFADVQIQRGGGARDERDRNVLPTLAHDPQRPVSTIDAEILEVIGRAVSAAIRCHGGPTRRGRCKSIPTRSTSGGGDRHGVELIGCRVDEYVAARPGLHDVPVDDRV
jgi:hypothetical protein